jgi:hypothetical protein
MISLEDTQTPRNQLLQLLRQIRAVVASELQPLALMISPDRNPLLMIQLLRRPALATELATRSITAWKIF